MGKQRISVSSKTPLQVAEKCKEMEESWILKETDPDDVEFNKVTIRNTVDFVSYMVSAYIMLKYYLNDSFIFTVIDDVTD